MDFRYTEDQLDFKTRLNDFLDKEMTEEIARQNWEDLGVKQEAREFSIKLAVNGFLGMSWPTEYGGKGLDPTYDFILLDELGKRWGAHVPLDVGYTMVGPTILRRGSDALKKEFLPRIIDGEIEFCLGYTEPDAGSDLASMQMEAVEEGDAFIVNGQKTFNTECHYSEYHWLAARTDQDPGASRHRSISLFIVDMDSPGITVRPMMTMSGEQTNEVFYDNVRVPGSRMVGENTGNFKLDGGLCQPFPDQRVIRQRPSIVVRFLYIGNHFVEDGHQPRRYEDLISLRAQGLHDINEALVFLADHSRWLESNDQPMSYEPEVTKVFISEAEQRLAKTAMQILGEYGQLLEDSHRVPIRGRIAWEYLHSFMTTLGGGTSEVGRSVIAQRGLGLPRSF